MSERLQNKFDPENSDYVRSSVRAKKELGQFFLRDRSITERIVEAVPVEPLTVEIGPGDGALTSALLDSGHRVIGIELDRDMVSRLQRRFRHRRDFRLISGSILMIDWESITKDDEPITVVGNLPYHLTSPIMFDIFHLIRHGRPRIVEMIVMVQKQVGQRITARSGGRRFGSLTLLTKYHGIPEYLFTVPADCFFPRPGVDGSVIRITFHRPEELPDVDYNDFRRIVRGSFAQRRKMMRNSMCVIEDLPDGWRDLDYDFSLRPEQFTFEEFINLTKDILKIKG